MLLDDSNKPCMLVFPFFLNHDIYKYDENNYIVISHVCTNFYLVIENSKATNV